jgi:hypothetical protein
MSSSTQPKVPLILDLLNVPAKWPASFPSPVVGTRVLTYVFDSKDDAKIDAFFAFFKSEFPQTGVSAVKDKDGFTIVSITQTASESVPASVPMPMPVPVDECTDSCPEPVPTLDATAAGGCNSGPADPFC